MARKKKSALPKAGTAFAFPLGDGRFSVCRVLLDISSERSKQWNGDTILVACASWIGYQVPRADDPALRPILHLKHHSWDNKPNVLWVSDEPPPDLIPIGTIEPTPKSKQFPAGHLEAGTHSRFNRSPNGSGTTNAIPCSQRT
jgi:hypothetical protein